jgi:hypothetical protein
MAVIVVALIVAACALVALVLVMLRLADEPADDVPLADDTKMWAEIRAALNRPNKENI